MFAPLDNEVDALPAAGGMVARASHPLNMTIIMQMLRGIVHDPTARRMGGVAGHAGLFSTADDLSHLRSRHLTPRVDKILSRPERSKR